MEGEVNPVRDFDIISEELRLKDEETLDKLLEKMEKTVIRANDKKLKPEYVSQTWDGRSKETIYEKSACFLIHSQDTLVKVKAVISEEKRHIRFADWSAHDVSPLT